MFQIGRIDAKAIVGTIVNDGINVYPSNRFSEVEMDCSAILKFLTRMRNA